MRTSSPAAAVIRSPSARPATAPGPPGLTPRIRTPTRSGRPTARRIRCATCAGATATPRRGPLRSPAGASSKKPSHVSSECVRLSRCVVVERERQPPGGLRVGGQRGLDGAPAPLGERDDHAAAVVGIGLAVDVARAGQAGQAHGHRPARAPRGGHDLALGEALVGRLVQRGEDVEARAAQPVLGERLLQLGLEVRGGAQEAGDGGGRRCVARSFAGGPVSDGVHVACSNCLSPR